MTKAMTAMAATVMTKVRFVPVSSTAELAAGKASPSAAIPSS